MDYNGPQYAGMMENGGWIVEGKRFESPSAAAGGIAVTKDGKACEFGRLDLLVCQAVRRYGMEPIKQLQG